MKPLSRAMYFILDDNNEPLPVGDVLAWAQWWHDNESRRRVGLDELGHGVYVSTVCLGIDHSLSFAGSDQSPPILWETMIFGGPHDMFQARYASQNAALEGHRRAVGLATRDLPQ